MRHSVDVDRYLINRPHQMIRHCLLQKGLGKKLDHTGIKLVGVGKFTIEYFQGNFLKRHSVDFGGDEEIPKCSCFTWRKSAYPCKHFFAIFQKFPAWNWTALSKLYRHSPYLILDEFQEDQNNEVFNDTAGENMDDPVSSEDFVSTNISESTNEHIVYNGLPQKKLVKERDSLENHAAVF